MLSTNPSFPIIHNSECELEWLRDDITTKERVINIAFALIYLCLLTVSLYINILIWKSIKRLQKFSHISIGLLLTTTIFFRLIYFMDPAFKLFSNNQKPYLWSYHQYLKISSTSICAQYELYLFLSLLWLNFSNFLDPTPFKKKVVIVYYILIILCPVIYASQMFLWFPEDHHMNVYFLLICVPEILYAAIISISGHFLNKTLIEFFNNNWCRQLRMVILGIYVSFLLRLVYDLYQTFAMGTAKSIRTGACEGGGWGYLAIISFFWVFTD